MLIRKWLRSAALLLVGTTYALACGPAFPPTLLNNRAAALVDLPEGQFDFEAAHLLPAPGKFPVVEQAEWLWSEVPPSRESVERGWLGENNYALVERMRDQNNDGTAYAAGEGLGEAARQYTAGAVAFARGQFDVARERFSTVLALESTAHAHYDLLARFMLGRLAALDGDRAAATAAFHAVRESVAAGADDPLGLAAGSFGEEARVALAAGDDVTAVTLYAQQAALGSAFGRTSLLFVARAIIGDPARFDRAMADATTRRLIASYLLTRSGELNGDVDSATPVLHTSQARIAQFLDAIDRHGIGRVDGADRFAAVAYRAGRYSLAARWAEKSQSGLAWWLRAKLALREGDTERAAAAYASAVKLLPHDAYQNFPDEGRSWEWDTVGCRIEAEHGVLALSRNEYVAALEHLYRAALVYWPDAAYVAERVVTLNELKAFVDRNIPAVPTMHAKDLPLPAMQLRRLLARRLLRAERYDEAIAYFDDVSLRGRAQDYVAARRATEHGSRIERAAAWYRAAKIARESGIDLLAYELEPDYQYYGGNSDLGYTGRFDENYNGVREPRRDVVVPNVLTGADEQARVVASRAEPLERFHYRYVAADFAGKAADLLPPRSQAFAAVLCEATGWVINRSPERANAIWQRYVTQGPYVPWAADFGHQCQAPDFPAAAVRLRAERIAYAKRVVRQMAPYAAAGFVITVTALIVWRRRRKNR